MIYLAPVIILVIVLVYLCYYSDGSYESGKRIIILSFVAVFYLCACLVGLAFKPEINSLLSVVKGYGKSAVDSSKPIPTPTASYTEGYLLKGEPWVDIVGEIHRNFRDTKVEIWGQKIVAADGSDLIQIYFLEGTYAGYWGYVRESSLSR